MNSNRRMQTTWRTPRSIAHARDKLAFHAGRMQRHFAAIAGDDLPARRDAAHLDLHPLNRRIDVSHRSATAGLLAQHVPRFQSRSQFYVHAVLSELANERATEFKMGCEPDMLEWEACRAQLFDHGMQVFRQEVG